MMAKEQSHANYCLRCQASQAPGSQFCENHAVEYASLVREIDPERPATIEACRRFAQRIFWGDRA